MIDRVAGSRGAFQFVASTSEVDELSDARLSIFIKARAVCDGQKQTVDSAAVWRRCYKCLGHSKLTAAN